MINNEAPTTRFDSEFYLSNQEGSAKILGVFNHPSFWLIYITFDSLPKWTKIQNQLDVTEVIYNKWLISISRLKALSNYSHEPIYIHGLEKLTLLLTRSFSLIFCSYFCLWKSIILQTGGLAFCWTWKIFDNWNQILQGLIRNRKDFFNY